MFMRPGSNHLPSAWAKQDHGQCRRVSEFHGVSWKYVNAGPGGQPSQASSRLR
jgi:hypothetical protein